LYYKRQELITKTEYLDFTWRSTWNHKVRHPRCVYNKLDWSVYTCGNTNM